jgi:hypothetical protein
MATTSSKWERRRSPSAWALLPLIVMLARPAGAQVVCQKSCCVGGHCLENDCAADEKCDGNRCRPICGAPGLTCLEGLICVNNQCTAPQCESNDDCDGGRCRQCRCEPVQECSADGGCDCTSNDDCAVGLACSIMGVCQEPVRPGPALQATCAFAGGRGTASTGPLAALLLAVIALGARRRRLS